MLNATSDEGTLIVLGVIESDDLCNVQVLKNVNIACTRVSI